MVYSRIQADSQVSLCTTHRHTSQISPICSWQRNKAGADNQNQHQVAENLRYQPAPPSPFGFPHLLLERRLLLLLLPHRRDHADSTCAAPSLTGLDNDAAGYVVCASTDSRVHHSLIRMYTAVLLPRTFGKQNLLIWSKGKRYCCCIISHVFHAAGASLESAGRYTHPETKTLIGGIGARKHTS